MMMMSSKPHQPTSLHSPNMQHQQGGAPAGGGHGSGGGAGAGADSGGAVNGNSNGASGGGRYSPPYRTSSDSVRRSMSNHGAASRNSHGVSSIQHSQALSNSKYHHMDSPDYPSLLQSGNQHGYLPHSVVSLQGNIFGGLDDSLLARAEALAATDISKGGPSPPLVKPDIYGHTDMSAHGQAQASRGQMPPIHGFGPGDSMLDQISAGMGMPGLTSMSAAAGTEHGGPGGPGGGGGGGPGGIIGSSHGHSHAQMYPPVYTHAGMNGMHAQHGIPAGHHPHGIPQHHPEGDCDPRELEAFAEHFKQRRIKLGVTQADVGVALGKLKLPGVGSLSQSTICRFESLTLSHNNMIALKPVLQAWLEEAERQSKENQKTPEIFNSAADKKRKRTSIAAPEKRSLEAYFAVQPRPSGEKIAQIAEKLDLKKNVVRVWFCNQRQKQKRMKFSAMAGGHTQNH